MPFLAVSIYVRACRSRCLVPFRRAGYRLSCLLLKVAEAEERGIAAVAGRGRDYGIFGGWSREYEEEVCLETEKPFR